MDDIVNTIQHFIINMSNLHTSSETMTNAMLPFIVLLVSTSLLSSVTSASISVDTNVKSSSSSSSSSSSDDNDSDELVCGIWFAKSTIPGAGLGIFAGKDFEKGKSVLPIGDVVIPLVDLPIHQAGDDLHFLWDEYTWDGGGLYMDHEGVADELNGASPGFGAGVNCFMDLVNIKETIPENNNLGLHRGIDPGAGAFSAYWNRDSMASVPIQAGNELFASYGSSWFTTREKTIGPVPLKGDLKRGQSVLQKFTKLENHLLRGETESNEHKSEKLKAILEDVWESFAWESPWSDTSRVLFGLPKNWPDLRMAQNMTLPSFKRKEHSTSVEWLEANGACGDWITVKPSTIRQAGRGAFSRRRFVTGDEVAPFPLIHVPYRSYLDMFKLNTNSGKFVADTSVKQGTQLLENYCMGHRESTMLLCPYGTLSDHINHNQTLANVKMVWADPARSNHQPSWLNKTLANLYKVHTSGMSMTLVATREIGEGDEIFLDYGDEWEEAWQQHVANWNPSEAAKKYIAAGHFNVLAKIIKTEFELMHQPWPGNVELKMNLAFTRPRHIWLKHWAEGTLKEFMVKVDDYFTRVEVLRREVDEDNSTWYTVVILEDDTDDTNGKKGMDTGKKKIEKVPREAFTFFDRPYTSDMHQANAFRHDIRIPDHLFPDLWKNLKNSTAATAESGSNGNGKDASEKGKYTEPASEPVTRSDHCEL